MYTWKYSGFSADANLVGNELEEKENKGELSSERVLRYAESNPIVNYTSVLNGMIQKLLENTD